MAEAVDAAAFRLAPLEVLGPALLGRSQPHAQRPEHGRVHGAEERHVEQPQVGEDRRHERDAHESRVAEDEAEHEDAPLVVGQSHQLHEQERDERDGRVEPGGERHHGKVVGHRLARAASDRRVEDEARQEHLGDKPGELGQEIALDDADLARHEAGGQDEEEDEHGMHDYVENQSEGAFLPESELMP